MTAPTPQPDAERVQGEVTAAVRRAQALLFGHSAGAVRDVLAAALDRQEIAQALYEQHRADVEWRDGVTLSAWAGVEQSTGEWYLEQADSVIAALLGSDQ